MVSEPDIAVRETADGRESDIGSAVARRRHERPSRGLRPRVGRPTAEQTTTPHGAGLAPDSVDAADTTGVYPVTEDCRCNERRARVQMVMRCFS